MDNPGRLVPLNLRSSVATDRQLLASLRAAVDLYFPKLWDDVEAFAWSDNEEEFRNVDPPEPFRITQELALSNDPARDLEKDLDRIPLRWRVDVAMSLFLYLTLDA